MNTKSQNYYKNTWNYQSVKSTFIKLHVEIYSSANLASLAHPSDIPDNLKGSILTIYTRGQKRMAPVYSGRV